MRLAGALPSEQNDEWLVQRRYLFMELMALVLVAPKRGSPSRTRRWRVLHSLRRPLPNGAPAQLLAMARPTGSHRENPRGNTTNQEVS